MEPGSTHDDSPYPRYRESSTTVWWALAIAVVLASAAGGYYYYHREKAAEPPAPLAPSSGVASRLSIASTSRSLK